MRYPMDLMDSQPKVLFYENSVVLAGIPATFRVYAKFEVTAFDPRVVVFDNGALDSDFLFALDAS